MRFLKSILYQGAGEGRTNLELHFINTFLWEKKQRRDVDEFGSLFVFFFPSESLLYEVMWF